MSPVGQHEFQPGDAAVCKLCGNQSADAVAHYQRFDLHYHEGIGSTAYVAMFSATREECKQYAQTHHTFRAQWYLAPCK